jgi:hypothetical protein
MNLGMMKKMAEMVAEVQAKPKNKSVGEAYMSLYGGPDYDDDDV